MIRERQVACSRWVLFVNSMVLRLEERCHPPTLVHSPSGHHMCQFRSLHLQVASADCFPIPFALHHFINGMLKLVLCSKTWASGRGHGTFQSQVRKWKIQFGANVSQPDK